ncbi:hypothetical protein HDU87_006114 [Geranomyces variabilis]|uniref:Ribonuclease P/MRP protein subunit POP5 n=1 Tax=Geranomyces variabilis TaxID=109894 RepID=A0AAD5TG63_9FUNG|nr:hypothetical protein HDU87_006114 [Geranomyces variabilis]
MVRFKNRFLLFRLHYNDDPPAGPASSRHAALIDPVIHGGNISSAVKESILLNFGDYGAGIAATSTAVKYFSPWTNTGVLRCARDHFELVWAALTFVTQLKGKSCTFRVVHVGGTIKSVQQETLDLDRRLLGDIQKLGLVTAHQSADLLAKAREEIAAIDV